MMRESEETTVVNMSSDDDVERQGLSEKLLGESESDDARDETRATPRDPGVHPAFFIV